MTTDQEEKRAAHEILAAQRALEEDSLLIDQERPEGAISRSYYAIFHAARAVLSVEKAQRFVERMRQLVVGI